MLSYTCTLCAVLASKQHNCNVCAVLACAVLRQVGVDLDPKVDFATNCRVFGLWCEEFQANFGAVTVKPPAGAAPRATLSPNGLSLTHCKELIPGKLQLTWDKVTGGGVRGLIWSAACCCWQQNSTLQHAACACVADDVYSCTAQGTVCCCMQHVVLLLISCTNALGRPLFMLLNMRVSCATLVTYTSSNGSGHAGPGGNTRSPTPSPCTNPVGFPN